MKPREATLSYYVSVSSLSLRRAAGTPPSLFPSVLLPLSLFLPPLSQTPPPRRRIVQSEFIGHIKKY